jgi:hypothetical protein
MKERALKYKNKSVYSCFGMINSLRIKIWMLGEKKLWTFYLGGLKGIYDMNFVVLME